MASSGWTESAAHAHHYMRRRTRALEGSMSSPMGIWLVIDSVATVFSQAYALARARAASHPSPMIRLLAGRDQADWEARMLERELAVLRGQRQSVQPKHQTYYAPEQRSEILQIIRLRGWSITKAANRFVSHPDTIMSWRKAIREEA